MPRLALMKRPGRAASEAAVREVEGQRASVTVYPFQSQGAESGSDGGKTDLGKDGSETREAYTERVGKWMTEAMIPSLERVGEMWQASVMTDGMARAVVAAAMYKAEKGEWPGSLEELVPGYLKDYRR